MQHQLRRAIDYCGTFRSGITSLLRATVLRRSVGRGALFCAVFLICGQSPGATMNNGHRLKVKISHLREIFLHSGINRVNFSPLERNVYIIKSSINRGNNAFGHTLYCTFVRDAEDPAIWDIVSIDFDGVGDWGHGVMVKGTRDCLSEYLLVADAGTTVRFFDGLLAGVPTTLLFVAERNLSGTESHFTSTPVDIAAFKLVKFDEETPPLHFESITKFTTNRKYDDADIALYCELSVPPPPTRINGVPTPADCSDNAVTGP